MIRHLVLPLVLTAILTPPIHAAQESAAADLVSDELYLAGGFAATTEEPLVLTRSELIGLPGFDQINARLVPGTEPATLGVISFAKLLETFPLADGYDGLVLETHNGWESFLTVPYLNDKATVLLLTYDGKSPSESMWPWFGGDIEPLAPFYAFDPGEPIPRFVTAPDYGMISATQIKGVRAVNTEERYAPFFKIELSDSAKHGRALFLQRCNGCHEGPGGVGGNVSERPYAVLHAQAAYNPDYFKKLVVNPDQFYPDTAMPTHEDLGDSNLDALVAFLKEAPPATAP